VNNVNDLSFLKYEYPLLKELTIKKTGVLTLEGIEKYSSLERLTIKESSLTEIPKIDKLPNLRYLNFDFEKRFKDFSVISRCTRLEYLGLHNSYMESFDFLAPLKGLKKLNLSHCSSLVDLRFLAYFSSLEELIMTSIYYTAFNCSSLLVMKSLRYFYIHSSRSIMCYDSFVDSLPCQLELVFDP
jgi:Leucine-rich repeat (LRR) protein